MIDALTVIDSHTAGEVTRTLVSPIEQLQGLSAVQQRDFLHSNLDWIRTSLILEPRGSDVMVGALVGPSTLDDCIASVVFFNNVGYLGMCGHGMIGVVTTLAYQGRLQAGTCQWETPVGIVVTRLLDDGRVQFENVPSYQYQSSVSVEVPGHGPISGDIAWGGNWFFLSSDVSIPLRWDCRQQLTEYAMRVRQALYAQGLTGEDGAQIDHFEFFSRSAIPEADADNFVLCPGAAFDRSPCGTGTSAKLACLAASGTLSEGQPWRQRSVTGGIFTGSYQWIDERRIRPTITGQAFVTGETQLVFDPRDALTHGLFNDPAA